MLAPIRVMKYHIDLNAHVNNSQYVAMALDCLKEMKDFRRIRVEYKQAAKLGDVIIPTIEKEDNIYYVTLCDEQMEPYTIITFDE